MRKNKGIIHIVLMVIGIIVALVLLGFFNTISKKEWGKYNPYRSSNQEEEQSAN